MANAKNRRSSELDLRMKRTLTTSEQELSAAPVHPDRSKLNNTKTIPGDVITAPKNSVLMSVNSFQLHQRTCILTQKVHLKSEFAVTFQKANYVSFS